MSSYPHKTPTLAVPLVLSLIIHLAAVGFTLTVPVFKGNVYVETYTVDLKQIVEVTAEKKKVDVKAKRERSKRMAAVKRKMDKHVAATEQAGPERRSEKAKPRKKRVHWPKRASAEKKTVRPPESAVKSEAGSQRSLEEAERASDATESGKTIRPTVRQKAQPAPNEEVRQPTEPDAGEVYKNAGWQDIVRIEKTGKAATEMPPVKESADAEKDEGVGPPGLGQDTHQSLEQAVPEYTDIVDENQWVGRELCEECNVASLLHENSALTVVNATSHAVDDDAEPPGDYSPVDGLCEGCSLLSYLRVNPIEEMLYRLSDDDEVEMKDRGPTQPMEIIEEMCLGCGLLAFIFNNFKRDQSNIPEPEGEHAGSEPNVQEEDQAAHASDALESQPPRAIVIEVPEAVVSTDVVSIVSDSKDESPEIRVIRDSDEEDAESAEVFTSEKNLMPTKEEYLAAISIKPESQKKSEETVASESALGLPLYVRKDVEIRVFFTGSDEGMSFRMLQKAHPMEPGSMVETDITEILEEISLSSGSGLRRMFSLARAGKGVYSFIVESENPDISDFDIHILFNKGLASERLKIYESVKLMQGERMEFKLLMPEAVLWDEDDLFTGEIEGAESTTKFNDDTGLIWKERIVR